MNFWECLKTAVKSLQGNKIRSFLTMLGIIIGITSVITMSAIGQGAQQNIMGDLKQGGYGKFTVSVDKSDTEFRWKYMLNDEIIEGMKRSGKFRNVSPRIQTRFMVKINGRNEMLMASPTNKDFEEIDKVNMLYGRNILSFEYDLREKVATIDHLTAGNLFGSPENAVGQTLDIAPGRNTSYIAYRIVGVFKNPLEQMIKIMGGRRIPRFVRIPVSTYDKMFTKTPGEYTEIIVEAQDPEKLAESMSDARLVLEELTGTADLYEVTTVSNAAESFDNILSQLNMFVSFVAAISLLVGGIGVMNIMLVSVIERTKEVGIRKAIGATNSDILIQFLMEAVILTGFGGVFGIALGVSLGLGIGGFLGIPPVFSPVYIFGSMLVSTIIGVVFGVTPARKAANLNPVDALRTE